ncbi:MAG: DUF5107 domain-containing protein [Candidatus Omnitrophica bacterium]|nr:DUF5107 domain-containing protein [Candidatus Omnitrophota bacterium]
MTGIRFHQPAFVALGLLLTLFMLLASQAVCDVQIWEEQITIPTYEVGPPDPIPRFYEGRVYQGAQGRIYPYPMSDVLSDNLIDKTYNAVYLENEYVKICVLPEIGGRIFTALDKTNGYDFFYRQHVVKPALIGMLGAWISGGVEWNFPHHHRSRTFMEMDHIITANPDGSKTVWMGELERRHRMRFLLGLTLHPGKSLLEATIKIFNRTPYVNSFLYFANPAVHVDETYQVIFPPETEYVTQHAKREFSEWPVSNSRYGGKQYDNVDISWWKNLPAPVSFFCWNYESDFFAGYDHGKDAGVAYVANHHIAPGKKFFTFGCGDSGKMWDKMLTDKDGPYLELMAGAYSDNQPDYSWTQPYEVKTVKQYWFPIRNLQGMTYANLEGAVNLEWIDSNSVKIRLNSVSEQKNAKIILKEGERVLCEMPADVSPSQPWQGEISKTGGIEKENLTLLFVSSGGRELLRYKPEQRPGDPMPEPVSPPKPPEEIESNEELYLAGLRLDQFHNAQVDPLPYYEEALRRDPGDSRVNTQLGILYCKQGRFAEAEEKLQTAVDRLFNNYTRPKDGEAYYYLGVAQQAQGKYNEAYDAFYRAAWSLAWRAAGYFSLAQLDCLANDFTGALDHLDQSLAFNALNTKALNLKAAVLRKLERFDDANQCLLQAAAIDPLDLGSRNERALLYRAWNQPEQAEMVEAFLRSVMKDPIQSNLEMAVDYGNAGFYDEAIGILSRLDAAAAASGENISMVYYYLAHYWDQKGDRDRAQKFYRLAAEAPADFGFPLRLESIDVLQKAIAQNPGDAMAPYYLGNFLFDRQPQKAMEQWRLAARRGCSYYVNYRNLGYACAEVENDLAQAIANYEKALELQPDDPRIYYELDRLYTQRGDRAEDRLAVMQKHLGVIQQRDDALQQMIALYVQVGEYDKAVELLTARHFHTWEGGGKIHDVYVDAYLLRGLTRMKEDRFEQALADFQASLLYPDNLEVAKPIVDEKAARAFYLIGSVYEQLGDAEKAHDYYQQSSGIPTDSPELDFYQGLALKKLEQPERAGRIFDRIIAQGKERLTQAERADFFAKFGERQTPQVRLAIAHYIQALGWIGKGDAQAAASELRQAIELNPNYAWAKMHLSELP